MKWSPKMHFNRCRNSLNNDKKICNIVQVCDLKKKKRKEIIKTLLSHLQKSKHSKKRNLYEKRLTYTFVSFWNAFPLEQDICVWGEEVNCIVLMESLLIIFGFLSKFLSVINFINVYANLPVFWSISFWMYDVRYFIGSGFFHDI